MKEFTFDEMKKIYSGRKKTLFNYMKENGIDAVVFHLNM